MSSLPLRVHPGRWAACRLPAGAPVPEPPPEARFWSATLTGTETSLIVPEGHEPEGATVEQGFAALEVEGPLDFSAIGILAGLASSLASAGIPILAVSTFDTDWLLVRADRLDEATAALESAGHSVAR